MPEDIEKSSKFWPDMIENYEQKYIKTTKKEMPTRIINPVRRELENKGITWPASVTLPATTTGVNFILRQDFNKRGLDFRITTLHFTCQ